MGQVLAFDFPSFSGLFEFLIPPGKDGLLFAREFVGRNHIANGAVKPNLVVMFNKFLDDAPAIFQGQRCPWSDAVGFEGVAPSFNFPVGLRMPGAN